MRLNTGHLIAGGMPILAVELRMTDVDPTPTENDPLIFSWDACVTVVVVVGGGGGDDDDDDDGCGSDDDSS